MIYILNFGQMNFMIQVNQIPILKRYKDGLLLGFINIRKVVIKNKGGV